MRLAVSMIAWQPDEDDAVAAILTRHGVEGVEFAPTRHWPDLAVVGDDDVLARRRFWNAHGLEIPAMQSLLFGRDDLQLFGDDGDRARMLEYLTHVVRIGALLGARVLVFGSPRNRRLGTRDATDGGVVATGFFRRLGDVAAAEGVTIGVEANPPEYGADFLTTHEEVRRFVRGVAHPAVVHHVDLGGLVLSREDPAEAVAEAQPLAHFHASAPYLAPLAADPGLGVALDALSRQSYDRWVSIEMRRQTDAPLKAIEAAVQALRTAIRSR